MSKLKINKPNLHIQVALDEICKSLEDLQYGSLLVVVQDGIVVQIDKTSKRRIDYSSLETMVGGEGI